MLVGETGANWLKEKTLELGTLLSFLALGQTMIELEIQNNHST